MNMKKRKKVLFAIFVMIVASWVGWLFRPYPVIDETRVHPALRGLDDSTKCEWTSFGDGGSIEIQLTRPDGTEVILSMSNSLDQSFSERGQLYIGTPYFSMPGSTKITGYDHTKYVVAQLLARNPFHASRDIAILTKRMSDWISFAAEAGPSKAYEELRIHM